MPLAVGGVGGDQAGSEGGTSCGVAGGGEEQKEEAQQVLLFAAKTSFGIGHKRYKSVGHA
jgi:ABC-type glycerol-3-phosphate transport system substrate-binding protein